MIVLKKRMQNFTWGQKGKENVCAHMLSIYSIYPQKSREYANFPHAFSTLSLTMKTTVNVSSQTSTFQRYVILSIDKEK